MSIEKRAVVVYVAGLIVGSVAGFWFEVAISPIRSLMLGGGMAMPFAFAAAALPLLKRSVREKLDPEIKAFVIFGALLTLILGAVFWFDDWPVEQARRARIERLRTLPAGSVTGMRIYDVRGGGEIRIKDPAAIARFVALCRGARPGPARGSSSGRPMWAVELYGTHSMLLRCVSLGGKNALVTGNFLWGRWDATKCDIEFVGSFHCPGLGTWFARHTAPRPGNVPR